MPNQSLKLKEIRLHRDNITLFKTLFYFYKKLKLSLKLSLKIIKSE